MKFAHKRHLIVRDWFFYAVWYVRLRKIFREMQMGEAMQKRDRLIDLLVRGRLRRADESTPKIFKYNKEFIFKLSSATFELAPNSPNSTFIDLNGLSLSITNISNQDKK